MESLSCPVCFDLFNDPHLLPCGHQFCFNCLKPAQSKITCPVCLSVCPLSDPTQLPTNFPLKRVVEALKQMTGPTSVACSAGCQKSALKYCSKCEAMMCSSCLAHHQEAPYAKKHTVVDVKQLKVIKTCQRHNEPMKMFCEKCFVYVCPTCFFSIHLDHKDRVLPIPEAATSRRKEVASITKPLETKCLLVSKEIDELETESKKLTVKLSTMEQSKDQLVKDRELLKQLIDTVNRVSRSPNDLMILDQPKFEQILGLLKSNHFLPLKRQAVGVVKNNPRFCRKIGSRGSDDGQLRCPAGVAIDRHGNIVVADSSNNRIQVFGPDGVFVLKFGCKGSGDGQFNYPYGVAIDGQGNIVVADSSNNRIQVFGPDGQFILKFGSNGGGNGQFRSPYGVAIDGHGNIVVTDYSNNRIQVFGSDGTFIRKIGISGDGDGQLSNPLGVAIDGQGNIVVTENSNNRIQVFAADGKFIRKFGSGGSGDGQLNCPLGVAIDGHGNIVVADQLNDRIQVFASNGKFMLKFGSNGSGDGQFSYPRGVAVDAYGSIVVADNSNNRIQLFG